MRVTRRECLIMAAAALTGCRPRQEPDASRAAPDARRELPHEPAPPVSTAPAPPSRPEPSTTTTYPVRVIEVVERAGWGAVSAGPGLVEHAVERLTIHHTGVELGDNRLAPSRLRAHQRFHQADRGWPDLAYHFAIDRGGHIYEGRSPEFRGDTATTYDPAGHLLVVLEGNFDIEATAEPQLVSLAELLAWAAGHYSVGVETIKSHRDYTPGETSCPGANLYDVLVSGALVDAVTAIISTERIELLYLRGAAAAERAAAIESADA